MSESFKDNITQADFKLFLALWNQMQGLTTPDIHFRMASWLENRWRAGDLNLLLMAFRSSGKSTITGIFVAWLIYRKPALRILVLAADHALAQKMVRNVRKIIEKHPLTSHLVPRKADQWGADRFTVKRDMEMRDPSVLAKGIAANMTGSRADLIICDDVEVPNTCDTALKRADLREKLSELNYVLVPGGTQIYIGTPHSYYSIYAEDPRTEIGEEVPFLSGFKRFKLPVMDENGESNWVERYGAADILRLKEQTGPNKFTSQMMLEPVNIAEGRLDPALLHIYGDDLDYTKEINTLFIGAEKIIAASAFWDPAFGSAKGDRSVLACVFMDEDGRSYIHHVEYIALDRLPDGLPDGVDEATAQCRIVAALARRFMLPSIAVETNGIGKFLPAILRNELAKAHVPTRIQEVAHSQAKDMRILEAYDAPMAAQNLYVHKSVLLTPFMQEMQEWRPDGKGKGHDDGIDAVAGALAQQPVRLKRIYGGGAFSWAQKHTTHTVKSDFSF